MKKSLVLGIALAASAAYLNAGWIRSDSLAVSGQEKSLAGLGTLVGERSAVLASAKATATETKSAGLSSLATGGASDQKSIGTRWKDAVAGQGAELVVVGTGSFEARQIPEAGTWAAGFAVSALLVVRWFGRR